VGTLGASEDGKEEHLPAGQHLLIDMKNIEADFLNSESRLADAMVAAVQAGGLTLLSYHCHSLIPAGVSCVGVLLESHISFHTWPDEGVITLDLFTCGSNPLIPVVPIIEELFGIPRENMPTAKEDEEQFGVPRQWDTETGKKGVVTLWSHELRGFRTKEQRHAHYLDFNSDLALWVTSPIDLYYKKEIVSTITKHQRIDIWDTLDISDNPSYEDGIKHNLTLGDPRWFTSEVASPERMLFVNGKIQILSKSEREYHESLVHSAMFAHTNPQNVAILGGGEGAALREVLKHKTVKSVTMVEIDEQMVEISKKYLPKVNSCADLVGSADSCFDDARTNLIIADGHQWFIDQKPTNAYDVIVMDVLNPNYKDKETGNTKLYSDGAFLDAAFASLTDDGVMVLQVGNAPNIHDPKADMGVFATREATFQMLEAHPQTAAMHVYEEAHCGLNEPQAFLLICKSTKCKEQWYANADVIDYQIYERISKTKSGKKALIHYDGSTQHSFRFPPKAWETVYCRREPTPVECAYLGVPMDRAIFEYDEESNFFHVSKDDSGAYHVKANTNIPKGSFVMPNHMASSFSLSSRSLSNLQQSASFSIPDSPKPRKIQKFLQYIDAHGHSSLLDGSGNHIVEIGASAMIQSVTDADKANVGRWGPSLPKRPVFSPVYDRHFHSFDVFLVATKDIMEGDEIFKYDEMWN